MGPKPLEPIYFAQYGKIVFDKGLENGDMKLKKQQTAVFGATFNRVYHSVDEVYIEPVNDGGVGLIWVSLEKQDVGEVFILSSPVKLNKNIWFVVLPLGCNFHYVISYNNIRSIAKEINETKNCIINPGIITNIYSFTYQERQKNFKFEGERHPFYEMIYVDLGSVEVNLENKNFVIKQGEVLFYDKNYFHTCEVVGNKVCSFLNVTFDSELKDLSEIVNQVIKIDHKIYDILKNMLEESGSYKKYSNETVFTLLQLLILKILQARKNQAEKSKSEAKEMKSGNRLVNRCEEYVINNLQENFTVSYLAKLLLVSESTLTKTFKKIKGISIGEFISKQKLEAAKRMILNGEYEITEIADRLGFCSLSYFSYRFTQEYGISPREYSRSIKGKGS